MSDTKPPRSTAGRKLQPVDPDSTLPLGVESDTIAGLSLRQLVMRVVEGPQKDAEFKVESDAVRIGSAADNSVVLADPTVSRYHAEISLVRPGFCVRDLGSRNGTFLEGNRVKEAFLTDGSKVRFGGTTLTFHIRRENVKIEAAAEERFGELVGRTQAMRQLFAVLGRVAPTEVTVVLFGETGTGKELAARALHTCSNRAAGPFAVLDCSAVDRELVSAELFGNEVGAYTGATTARPGAFESAHGGTIFLDEIGELPLELQAKLLRALEQREVRRLGGARPIRVDCRVVAATHRNLKAMVAAGTFREDLYYRLAQVVIRLPPLRERRDDIPLLVERFLAREPGTRMTPAALQLLRARGWRGNLRELRNTVDRARAMARGRPIGIEHLELEPEEKALRADGPAAPASTPSLAAAEREVIETTLKACQYHRARAAAKLGISLPTLRERIRRYGIAIPPPSSSGS